jgi:hypothetical protein
VLFVICCSFRVSFCMFCSILCLVSLLSDFERGVRYFCNAMVSAANCYCLFVEVRLRVQNGVLSQIHDIGGHDIGT